MRPIPDDLAATLLELGVAAGRAIMAVYADADLGVVAKADDSPVTRADLAADAVIGAGLAAWGDIPVVTEERAESQGAQTGRFFLVDPLDGTREFVERRGDFTVNIALIDEGVPVMGMVLAPALGRVWRTLAPDRAVGQALDAGGAPVPGTEVDLAVRVPDPAGLVVVASKSHRDAATDALIAGLPVRAFRSAGSSLKFCLLAAGEADFYPRLGRTMEWDTAAGHAVLAAAGGRVIRFDDRKNLRYGKANFENPHFLALVPGVTI